MNEQDPLSSIFRLQPEDDFLSEEDRQLISKRMEDLRLNPGSAVSLEAMKKAVLSRFSK